MPLEAPVSNRNGNVKWLESIMKKILKIVFAAKKILDSAQSRSYVCEFSSPNMFISSRYAMRALKFSEFKKKAANTYTNKDSHS